MVFSFFSRKNDNKTQTTMPGLADPKIQEFNDAMVSKLKDAGVDHIDHISRRKADPTLSTASDHGNGNKALHDGAVEVHENGNIRWGAAVETKRAAPGGVVATTKHGMDFALTGDVVQHHRGPTVNRRTENNYTAAPNGSVITTDRGGVTKWIEGQTADMIKGSPKIALQRIWEAFRKNSLNPEVEDLSFDDLMGENGFNGDLNGLKEYMIGYLAESQAKEGTKMDH